MQVGFRLLLRDEQIKDLATYTMNPRRSAKWICRFVGPRRGSGPRIENLRGRRGSHNANPCTSRTDAALVPRPPRWRPPPFVTWPSVARTDPAFGHLDSLSGAVVHDAAHGRDPPVRDHALVGAKPPVSTTSACCAPIPCLTHVSGPPSQCRSRGSTKSLCRPSDPALQAAGRFRLPRGSKPSLRLVPACL